jgi:hypothetical protein
MALGLRSRYLHAPTIIPAKNLCSISSALMRFNAAAHYACTHRNCGDDAENYKAQ